ncbi:hypothetical protein D3C81_1117070 [compost metagenome]
MEHAHNKSKSNSSANADILSRVANIDFQSLKPSSFLLSLSQNLSQRWSEDSL